MTGIITTQASASHTATNGDQIPADSPKAYTYHGATGPVETITITALASGKEYVKTYTYDGNDRCTAESGWVLQ